MKMEIASRKSVHFLLCSLVCLLFGNLSLVAIVTSQQQQTIIIPNQHGNLSNYLCGNLSSAITNGTTLELNPDEQHVVSGRSCVWQNRHHLTVQSSGPKAVTIQCAGDDLSQGMFGFVQVSDIRLRNLRFENCGGIIQSAGTEGRTESELFVPRNTSSAYALSHNQQAVLFLSHCTNVTIENVTFNNYSGYAIYAINLFGDTILQQVTVTNSFAFENDMTSCNGTDLTYSGSGMYFQFINKTLPLVTRTNSNVTMTDCEISNNFNIYPDFFLNSLLETRLQDQPGEFPLYGAGGLTVHFEQSQYKVQLYVENTNFTNNGGSAGGGGYITTQNTLDNSDIIFTGCTFVNNRIHDNSYFEGAGIKLSFIFYFPLLFQVSKYAGATKANITVMNSIFQSHSAKVGAAMAIFTEAQNISSIKVDLKNVTFIDNEATIDGDCITAKSEDSAYFSEAGFRINLESIQVMRKHNGSHSVLGKSVALSFTNIDFVDVSGTDENPSVISNGKNGAVKAFNTNLFLSGNVQFRNNSATRGGAIALEANSHLFFKEPTNILFLNNSAKKGGAIYSDIISGYQCVMQFISHANDNSYEAKNISDLGKKLKFNITFINNRAKDGNAVYAQPIYNCSWYSGSVVQVPTDDVENVYRKLLKFEANQTYEAHMRSHPYRPCFCEVSNSQPVCRSDLSNHKSVNLSYPGHPFNINVVPADRRWRPLRAVVESKLEEESGIQFENKQQVDVMDINATSCFNLTYVLRKYHDESVNTTIKLSTLDTVGQFIEIDVSLEKCPFGFKLNEASGICECVPLLAQNNVQCIIKTGQFIKAETYWIGKTHFETNNITACATKCPAGYCQRNTTVNYKHLDDQCLGNRRGEICGQCTTPNLQSMKFGTTECGYCSNYWLFTIFLYMLAGIVLVIILFLLKLTISEGPFSAVIFYAQLLSINLGTLVYSSKIAKYAVVFISLLNLELGFPICFYNGMDQIRKQGLQFVFPVYLWLIVAVITILSRHSNKLANLVGSDCAKVFVTLIYLSYTKLLRTSSAVFVPARIGTDTNHTYLVWFFDGSVSYFEGLHLLLGLIALAFLLFILTPYKVFIFLGQWCLHNSWISRHFKPLIDATLTPFKDRWRFWFGMRLFIIDSFILVSIVVSPLSSNSAICANLIIVVLLLVFQVNIKPYKSKLLHYLDLFFLVNYILFLIGYLFIHRILPSDIGCHACTNAVEILLIGSAFVVFVMIVGYYITVKVREFSGRERSQKLRDVNMNEIETTPVQISHDTMQRVIAMDLNEHESVRLRESLLADD